MTFAARVMRFQSGGPLSVLAGIALVACGNLTSSPGEQRDTAADGGTSAEQAGTTSQGGARSGAGGTSGDITLVMTTGGTTMTTGGTTSSNTPLDPGSAGEGGQPYYPAIVNLCIYPEDIPEHWGGGGVGGAETDERGCVVGEVGEFTFMDCRYDLRSPTPFPVDIFVGGHSRCCYAARLISCK
jgi:hypothetical protein